MYIKKKLTFEINYDNICNLSFVENLWINIKIAQQTIVVGIVYRVHDNFTQTI